MGADDTTSGNKQRRRRKKAPPPTSRFVLSDLIPGEIVCTTHDLKNRKNSTELGLFLVLAVIGLYLYAWIESIKSLPDISTGRHIGVNMNLAMMEMDIVPGSHSDNSEIGLEISDVHRETSTENTQTSGKKEKKKQHKKKKTLVADSHAGVDKQDDIPIPAGTWPVAVGNEKDNYETMIHVGDLSTVMLVPKFWSGPVHNNKQFTRKQAMQIGTCAEPDPVTGSSVRGDACPISQRTIYVGIASYRDFQCRETLESVFLRAENPKRIRVGVVDQIVVGEDVRCDDPIKPCEEDPEQALCKYKDQVDVYTMDAPLSVGPVFARHIGYRLYRGEYYATQSDAHVSFTQNWDTDIIHQMEATHDDMAVLSTYLTDIEGSIDPVSGKSLRNTRPIMCNTYYEGGAQGLHLRHGSQPERVPSVHGSPQLQPWWAAGYSFSRGHFVVNVPYDYLQSMIFQGEEMSIGIRGFTVGYDFYAPERSVCFHHYANGKNKKKRNKVKHFWENGKAYEGTGIKAMKRLLGIVHMNPEIDPSEWDHTDIDRYGLGGVRTPEQFYQYFGIDVVKKKTQGHLCEFVQGAKMHRSLSPLLRKDGMGIDYSTFKFHWVDPNVNDPSKLGV
mmetsp:Transcript_17374/g.17471  ORF Transcript_17374/g.17471 Transcript_17374/m.17471 type:complete len:613 (-) Transcript_17374:358-2196(-)